MDQKVCKFLLFGMFLSFYEIVKSGIWILMMKKEYLYV